MLDFHEKRKLKGYLFSKYVAGALMLVSALLSLSVYERYEAERKMAGKREELAHELNTLESRAAALESEVSRLKSDRGIEEEIRDRYEVSKQGEKIVIILGENDATTSTAPSKSESEETPRGLFGWFKGE